MGIQKSTDLNKCKVVYLYQMYECLQPTSYVPHFRRLCAILWLTSSMARHKRCPIFDMYDESNYEAIKLFKKRCSLHLLQADCPLD